MATKLEYITGVLKMDEKISVEELDCLENLNV
jgi:hypothetical protein